MFKEMLFELIVRFTEVRERRGESKRLSGSGETVRKLYEALIFWGPPQLLFDVYLALILRG